MFKEPLRIERKRGVMQMVHDGLSSDDEFGGGSGQENVEPLPPRLNQGSSSGGTVLIVNDEEEEEDPLLLPSPQKKKAKTSISPVKPKRFIVASPLPRTRDEDDLIF
jgi:hypothetical protein